MLRKQPPKMFKPLLWGLKWNALNIWENKEEIILAALNYGKLKHIS